ncbi:MAG TPA: type II CAAX endopeptidase family protein [Bryobacteraceae bacterium]|nr:type II CAAX endopeptidase family protein [Bryobacteraceae bacterium]
MNKIELASRVGLFVLLGWLGVVSFPVLAQAVGAGLLVTSALSSFAAGAIANAVAVRTFERGRLSDFGLGWSSASGAQLLVGLGLGAAAASTILGLSLLTHAASIDRTPLAAAPHPIIALVLMTFVLLFGAAGEEMLFHGYAFQLLVRSAGAFATILPVGVIFGLAHVNNQNATAFGAANTAAWGILLGFAYWRTEALWLPIGLHFGWNVALPLFGAKLSGFTMGLTGYALHWSVGSLWSGGDYGPEGSLSTTLAVIALFWVVAKAVPVAAAPIDAESSRK